VIGLSVHVLDGNLRFGVGTKIRNGSGFADFLKFVEQKVAVVNRRRHQGFSFVRRIPKHHPLVASALFIKKTFSFGDTLRNVSRLFVKAANVLKGFGAEFEVFMIVTNFMNNLTSNRIRIDLIPP